VRALTFALVSALSAALFAGALLACNRASPTTSSPGFDVYVPMPGDGGDASVSGDAAEGGFGLGQIDRAGRPLVSVLLVPGSLQDGYNDQPSFTTDLPRVYQDAIASRIAELDTLVLVDGGAPDPVDWPDGGVLLPMLLGDTLFVDTALPCTGPDGGFVPSYLDIEREAFLLGPPYTHTTCSGRTPNEAVIDETLTLLVTGPRQEGDGGPVVTQGVAGPARPATTTFPYLAPPN
jgi:hypothetical protein